jgi:hypothetical protein
MAERRERQQVKTKPISIESVMRTAAFRRGVRDVRSGRENFDRENEVHPGDWHYERGRAFAILAPPDLEVVSPRTKQLNPRAVAFFLRHSWEIL